MRWNLSFWQITWRSRGQQLCIGSCPNSWLSFNLLLNHAHEPSTTNLVRNWDCWRRRWDENIIMISQSLGIMTYCWCSNWDQSYHWYFICFRNPHRQKLSQFLLPQISQLQRSEVLMRCSNLFGNGPGPRQVRSMKPLNCSIKLKTSSLIQGMMQLGKVYLQSAGGSSRSASGKMNVYQKTKQKSCIFMA